MTRSDYLRELTGKLLTEARRAGATEADAIAVSGAAVSVDVRDGRLEHAERAEGVEIGLRVLIGGRQASVAASDHTDRTISELAARAVAMAREAPSDDTLGLADPDQLTRVTDQSALELCDQGAETSAEDLRDLALRAEAAALEVAGISQIEFGLGQPVAPRYVAVGEQWLFRRLGPQRPVDFDGGDCRTGAWDGAGLGRESRVHRADLPSPEDIGREAALRTVARIGAKKPPTGSFPILYDQRVSAGLIGHLLSAINGAAIARGSSWLRNDLGELVLPQGFDLIEEPHLPRMSASRLFDGEGLATRRRKLVDQGVLTGWVLDLASARKLGLEPTANASRGVSSPPAPGLSNVTLTVGAAGAPSPEALIRDMGRGLIVTSMLGASVNPTTGDYSRGASGFWVENGEIAYPVNECTIAGNLREMLMRISAADDLPEWRQMTVPSLLVEGMTVAGA